MRSLIIVCLAAVTRVGVAAKQTRITSRQKTILKYMSLWDNILWTLTLDCTLSCYNWMPFRRRNNIALTRSVHVE